MSAATAMPADIARWATKAVGPISEVRDASHERVNSRVRKGPRAQRGPVLREGRTRAGVLHQGDLRLPARGAGARGRQGSGARGQFASSSRRDPDRHQGNALEGQDLSPRVQREAHRQAGALLRRFHEAMTMTAESRAQAHAVGTDVAVGVEKNLHRAGACVTADEALLLRRFTSRLPDMTDGLQMGLRHGDFWEHNPLWDGQRLSLIDFERSGPSGRESRTTRSLTNTTVSSGYRRNSPRGTLTRTPWPSSACSSKALRTWH